MKLFSVNNNEKREQSSIPFNTSVYKLYIYIYILSYKKSAVGLKLKGSKASKLLKIYCKF